MVFLETIKEAFRSLAANKLRSLLTSLGVWIGVLAVIVVVSLIQGFFSYFNNQFSALGASTIIVNADASGFRQEDIRRRVTLTKWDGEKVTDLSPAIDIFCPIIFQGVRVGHGDDTHQTVVFGSTPNFPDVNAFFVDTGRFFNKMDEEHKKKVVIIGEEIQRKLRLPDDPIGDSIKVNNSYFTIIGMFESRGDAFGQSQDDFVSIPFSTGVAMFGRKSADRVQLRFKAASAAHVEEAESDIRQILRREHNLRVDMPDDFSIVSQQTIVGIVNKVNKMASLILGGLVSITLIVGGIGIANIMLVSVTERTREIGVRMAVGATRSHILLQFLTEAAVLGLFGGLLGIMTGIGVAQLGNIILKKIATGMTVSTPLWAIALSLGFSAITGILAGLWPAIKASNQDPIESLRHE